MKKLLCTVAVLGLAVRAAAGGADPKLPLDELLETPISTAAKYDQQMSQVAASVTVVTAEDIERYGWTTLAEVLQSVRGFYITDDRSYSYIGLRGISRPTDYNNRLLILLDGMTLNDPFIGKAMAGGELAIDLATVEKIEIVRGPGSALYGDHAMLAVINIVRKDADAMAGVSVSAGVASRQKDSVSLRFGRVFGNGLALTASALWQNANGPDLRFPEFAATGGGIARGLDYEDVRNAVVGIEKGNFRATASSQSANSGIPTASYGTQFGADSSVTNRRDLAQVEYHRTIGADKTLELRGYWGRTHNRGRWPYSELGIDGYDALQAGGEARLHWDLRPNQRLTAGTELADVSRAEYSYVLGDFHVRLSRPYDLRSYYLQYEYHPSRVLGFVAGARHDGDTAAGNSTSPRAAILFTPNRDTAIKLLYGSAFRYPNLYEAYYADPVTPWKANPDLEAEMIRTLELVWEQRLCPQAFLMASLYHIGASGLIDQQVDPADSVYEYQNLGSLESNGIEAGVQIRTRSGWWANANWSVQKATGDGSPLTNSPRHLLKGRISSSPGALYHGALEAMWESGRLTRDGGETGAFLLLNGVLSRRVGPHTRLNLTVHNLFDTRYSTPVGPELVPQSVQQDGRTLALKLTYTR